MRGSKIMDKNDVVSLYKKVMQFREESIGNPNFGFDLPLKEFVCTMGLLTPQSYGSRFERYMQEKYGFKSLNSKDGMGDFSDELSNNYELKVSLITTTNTDMNMVQIRPYQTDINRYMIIAVDVRGILNDDDIEIYLFMLTKEEMMNEIKECKATSAHIHKSAISENQNIEYRMSIPIKKGNDKFERWIEKYYKKDLSKRLFQ